MTMGELFERRAEELGVTFTRNKTLDELLHSVVGGGPLLDLLFAITRPLPREPKMPAGSAPPNRVTYNTIVHYQTGVARTLAPGLRELPPRDR